MAAHPGIQRLKSVTRRVVSRLAAHPSAVALVVALVLPLGWVVYDVWFGRHGIHAPGPVATVHERFDCKDCHVRPWQPLERVHLAMDQACVRCHQGLVHHREEIPEDVPNCVSCHREHQGNGALTAVADGSCTTCHADLRTVAGPSARYARSVTGFASHPEFAALRQGRPDRPRIRFNHAKHLPRAGLSGLDGKPVMPECASCHRPTPDGRYMEAIAFQTHCADCHSNALVYDIARFRDPGTPHGVQPELLRGLVRERYTQFIRRNPGELKNDARVRRPIPGRPSHRSATELEWDWVGLQVEKADYILFQSSSGCRYCHDVEAAEGTLHISPTNIPKRWFGHSRFSHFSHRLNPKRPAGQQPLGGQENCTTCHEFARRSSKTDDVLMPSIRKCRECHDQGAMPAERARTDCVACHIYHNEVGGRRTLVPTLLPDDQEVMAGRPRPDAKLGAAEETTNPARISPTLTPQEVSSLLAWLSSPGPRSSPTPIPPSGRMCSRQAP